MPLPALLINTTEADLQRLIDEQEAEGPHLEFKREAPRNDGQGRHELAADISAMANSGGGDVIYGMDEGDDGVAGQIVPFAGNADQEQLRLLDMLGAQIEPRLPGLQVHVVAVEGGSAFVVRVPQSWAGPHRVRTNQHFYVREGGRKRQLDIPEIRNLFLRTDSQAQKVRDFRSERVGAILSGQTPARLVEGAVQVLHLIPTQSGLGLMSVDPVPYLGPRNIPVLGANGWGPRINVDGALAVRNADDQGRSHGYSLFFRNGYFETVKVETWGGDNGRTALGSIYYERNLIELVETFREELRRLGYSQEMSAMWSLLGADRTELGLGRQAGFGRNIGNFDRRTILIPDVLLRAEQPVEQALRPMFDLIWQAAGLRRSFNYDDQGNWAPQQ